METVEERSVSQLQVVLYYQWWGGGRGEGVMPSVKRYVLLSTNKLVAVMCNMRLPGDTSARDAHQVLPCAELKPIRLITFSSIPIVSSISRYALWRFNRLGFQVVMHNMLHA